MSKEAFTMMWDSGMSWLVVPREKYLTYMPTHTPDARSRIGRDGKTVYLDTHNDAILFLRALSQSKNLPIKGVPGALTLDSFDVDIESICHGAVSGIRKLPKLTYEPQTVH